MAVRSLVIFLAFFVLLSLIDSSLGKGLKHDAGKDASAVGDLKQEDRWEVLVKMAHEKGLKKLREMFLKLKKSDNGKHLSLIESALKTIAVASKD
ncbi:uncharacterized protein LOC133187738 isoform X1 [Saccostrea echinata]|uniref:uncharacterized protein LOC133187738 isoform X1 n=1 Tax=Saccostrea echinata TaxID=191078 RepID=UPI002A826594|nr:uncharacterized protein LOC133187738 isoform X1 [Saccostrea echinata]